MPQISAVIVRMSIHGSSDGTSIPRETAAQPQNKYLRWQSCPLPPPPTHTHIWSDANRHLLTLHSLDHLNSRGWQGKWASLGYKSPNLDWLSLSAGWHERATVTHRVRRARDCSDASKKAGCRSLAVGEGEERLLWRKVSDWVSIQTGVGICLALIWHQYLCPHLCSLSVHAIPRPVSPRLWQCLFGLC